MPEPPTDPNRLPAIFDAEQWQRPATEEQLRTVVAGLFTLLEPTASPERVKATRETIALQRYSSAELALIAREVPFRKPYGPRGVHLDIIGDVVRESREAREALDPKRSLTEAEKAKVLALPDVDPRHFHVVGFDSKNNPLYRYAAHLGDAPAKAVPMLEEATPPKRLRDGGTGTFSLGDLADGIRRKPPTPPDSDHPF